MFRRGKDLGCVLNFDDVVERRMHHHQRLPQAGDLDRHVMCIEVVDELSTQQEGPSAEIDLGLTGVPDGRFAIAEQMLKMRRHGRRTDGCDGPCRRDLARGREHRGTTQ